MTLRPGVAAILLAATLGAVAGAQTERTPAAAPEPARYRPVRMIHGHLFAGQFVEPAGVYYDRRQRELFVCDPGRHRIAVVNDAGVPTFSFGSSATLGAPKRVAVDAEGRIHVADPTYTGIRVFDFDGEPLDDVDLSGVPPAEKPMRPSALTFDEKGALLIADRANRRIVILDPGRAGVEVLDAPAARSDVLRSPVDLELTPAGEIAVADSSGLAVQIFSRDGRFLRGWGEHDVGRHNFSLPSGLAVDDDGWIYVSDTLRQDVKVFAADGTFLTQVGGFGAGPGGVDYPVDVAVDGNGRLFVAEKNNLRVQVFSVEKHAPTQRKSTQPAE